MSTENEHAFESAPRGLNQEQIRPDHAIENDILDLFRKDNGIEHWSISVSVKDGSVLLTGHVKDETMRVQAEFVLKAVEGVLEVRNELHSPVEGEETEDMS